MTQLDTPLGWTIAALYGLLVFASTLFFAVGRLKPAANMTELTQRTNTWWIMVTAVALALTLGRTLSLVFFALISALALREFLSLVQTRSADRRVLFWAFMAIPVQYYWVATNWYGMFIIFIPVFVFLLLPTLMVLIGETEGFLKAAGTLHWGLVVTVFSISHMAFLLVLPDAGAPAWAGAALVLYLLMLTQLNDVAQFCWGKLLGRHKVVPTVSPNKTYGGLLGGLVTTTLLATFLGPWLTPLSQSQAALSGLLIGMSGFIGDVVISALKRDMQVKDSGSLLPGHGGILDRLDSLCYTAPLFFHYVRYLHY